MSSLYLAPEVFTVAPEDSDEACVIVRRPNIGGGSGEGTYVRSIGCSSTRTFVCESDCGGGLVGGLTKTVF